MPRAFSCLPYVEDCCTCIDDLRLATYLITIYATLKSLTTLMNQILPLCVNLRGISGFGFIIYIFDMVLLGAGLLLLIFTMLMGVSTIVNRPIVKPFIIMVYIVIAMSCIIGIMYIVRLQHMNLMCQQRYYGKNKLVHVHPIFLVLHVFSEIIISAMFIYFTIVVNSYAKQWDRYGGQIPRPELPPLSIFVVPHPGHGGQGGQRNLGQDYPGYGGQGGQGNLGQDYPGGEDPQQPRTPQAGAGRRGFMARRPKKQNSPQEQDIPAQGSKTSLQQKSPTPGIQVNVVIQQDKSLDKQNPKQSDFLLRKNIEDGEDKQQKITPPLGSPTEQTKSQLKFRLESLMPNIPPSEITPVKPLAQLAYLILNSSSKNPTQKGSPEREEPPLSTEKVEPEQESSEKESPKPGSPEPEASKSKGNKIETPPTKLPD